MKFQSIFFKFNLLFYLVLFSVLIVIVACNEIEPLNNTNNNTNNSSALLLKNSRDTISYCLGVVVAKQMEKYGIDDVNEALVAEAITKTLTSSEQNLQIHPEVAKRILNIYVKEQLTNKLMENISEGERFLLENSQKSDITVLPGGVQYKIITNGTGAIPKLHDNITINYEGKLIDGSVFVSTKSRTPVSFRLSTALRGWQVAISKMQVGSKWILYLPPEYAFGHQNKENIPPNSVVIYEIELLSINLLN